jgi:hypothetical protein
MNSSGIFLPKSLYPSQWCGEARLNGDGTWPRETFSTERTIYPTQLPDSYWSSPFSRNAARIQKAVLAPREMRSAR